MPDHRSLRAGDAVAEVWPELGGRLGSLRVGGRELLLRRPADGASISWGCYLMAPWAGRLADGRLPWDGTTLRLRRTHGRHAIHGLVWDRAWRTERVGDDAAILSCDLPRDQWPMGGVVRQRLVLRPDALTLEAEIEAGEPMPAALGWHPWFDRRGGEVRVRLDASEVLVTDGMIPTGERRRVSGRLDLRGGPELGSRRLDHAFVGVRSPAAVRWPDLDLELRFGPECGTAVVYTPPRFVCVEPQTAPPNALALPPQDGEAVGVRYLAAGELLRARLELAWR